MARSHSFLAGGTELVFRFGQEISELCQRANFTNLNLTSRILTSNLITQCFTG